MNQNKNNEALYDAAKKGDNETISRLLKSSNVDVNFQKKDQLFHSMLRIHINIEDFNKREIVSFISLFSSIPKIIIVFVLFHFDEKTKRKKKVFLKLKYIPYYSKNCLTKFSKNSYISFSKIKNYFLIF
jgi:hypothetical protein